MSPGPALLLALCLVASTTPWRADAADLSVRVVAGHQPAAGAVVWLEAPEAPRPARPVTLDQRNLAFDPGLLVVPVGTTVRFPNNDRVLHNVFSFKDGKRFDLGLYPVGMSREIVFDKAGVSRLFCNIHPGMAAYIVAVASPYFATSDRDGRLVLRDVPPGAQTWHAWRPGAAPLTGTVSIDGQTPLEVLWPAR